MGNCLDRPRGGRGGDDAVHCATKPAVLVEEEKVPHKSSEKAAAPVTEVKIRITRKQLEELLRRLEGKDGDGGAAVAELLCMTSSCNFRHRPGEEQYAVAGQWRPSLQSIPE